MSFRHPWRCSHDRYGLCVDARVLASISRWHREMAYGNQDKGLMHETLAAILGQWPESRTQLCPFQSVEGFDECCATRRWLKCGFTADSAVAEDFNKQGAPRLAEPTCFSAPLGFGECVLSILRLLGLNDLPPNGNRIAFALLPPKKCELLNRSSESRSRAFYILIRRLAAQLWR